MAVLKALLTGKFQDLGFLEIISLSSFCRSQDQSIVVPKSITPVQDTLQIQKRMQKNFSQDLRKRCNCQRASPVLEMNAEPS